MKIALTLAVVLQLSSLARAQDVEEEPATALAYSARDQSLAELVLRADLAPPDRALRDFGQGLRFDLSTGHPEVPDTVSHGFGAGFGLTDRLEAGLAIPLRLGPALELDEIVTYARYRLSEGEVEVSAQLDVHVPLAGQAVVLSGAVPLSIRFAGGDVRLDTGARIDVDLDRPEAVDLFFPAALSLNPIDSVFAGARSGARIIDLDQSDPSFEIPIGGFVGYTFDFEPGPIDVSADLVYYLSNDVFRERFEIRFGATFHFDLDDDGEAAEPAAGE